MRKELRLFFTAMMFLTRLPVPRYTDHSQHYLERCSKYFPLVGWLVGAISAGALAAGVYLFSAPLGVLLSIVAGILATGAFHEDGFADVCDAFGGGWTKEKILDIMKDSRLGTYGVTGLALMLAVKFSALLQLTQLYIFQQGTAGGVAKLAALILFAHSASRLMPLVVIQISRYTYAGEQSKAKPLASARLSAGAFLWALLCTLPPFFILPLSHLLLFVPMLLATLLLNSYFKKWIHGYTGDCLGAVQQLAEAGCYLTAIVLWKFI